MISVAYDITSLAVSPFGGIAQVCYHTLAQARASQTVRPVAWYRKGNLRQDGLANIPTRKVGPLSGWFGPEADILHALCHRKPPIRARRSVYTLHDTWSLQPNRWQPSDFQARVGPRMRREIERSDLIVTISESTRQALLSLKIIPMERVVTVMLGATPSSIKASTGVGDWAARSRPYVLFVGRLEARKNIGHIVRAVAPLSPLDLVLVGEPGHGYETEVVECLGAFPAERLTVISQVAPAELDTIYRHAFAALVPSWEEGFGLPVLEAMVYGVPVITSNCSGCAEVGGDGAILVDPNEPAASTEALAQLLSDAIYRNNRATAARNRASLFSWEAYFRSLSSLYSKLIAG